MTTPAPGGAALRRATSCTCGCGRGGTASATASSRVLLDIDRMAETLGALAADAAQPRRARSPSTIATTARATARRCGRGSTRQLAAAGLRAPRASSCWPFRGMWGFVFNPLSVYFCFDEEDGLTAVIYEVKNTFGDQIAYVRPAGPPRGGVYRHGRSRKCPSRPSSPWTRPTASTWPPPGARLALRIRQAGTRRRDADRDPDGRRAALHRREPRAGACSPSADDPQGRRRDPLAGAAALAQARAAGAATPPAGARRR